MANVVPRFDRRALPARWDPFRELEEVRERLDRAWLVEADPPGVKKGDVTAEVRDNELAIHGEVKERERSGILRRRTRRAGEFDSRVTLPGEVDAQLNDGVLSVRIARPARAQPRRIEVKGG